MLQLKNLYKLTNEQLNSYNFNIKKAIIFLQKLNFDKLEQNRYDLDDSNDIFVLVSQLTTKNKFDVLPEVHKTYIDLHLCISGQEKIYFSENFKEAVVNKDDMQENDYINFKADFNEKNNIVLKNTGDFILIPPGILHRPQCFITQPESLHKIVVKIRNQ